MSFSITTFHEELGSALAVFDNNAANELCKKLIKNINKPDVKITTKDAARILKALKNKRLFRLMQIVGDALINAGYSGHFISKLYAQALIDDGVYGGALHVLNQLIAETENDSSEEAQTENEEAHGLKGRVYKQIYVNANEPDNPVFQNILKLAVQEYKHTYDKNGLKDMWQAINQVALIFRAKRDGITISDVPEPYPLALDILSALTQKEEALSKEIPEKKLGIWENAIALEACVAANEGEKALQWANKYVTATEEYTEKDPDTGKEVKKTKPADAFELGSTLRQMQEIWQLDEDKGIGRKVLPILQAALLKQQGGEILLDPRDLLLQRKSDKEYALNLEKNFSDTRFLNFDWYMKGKDRCLSVAKIGTSSNSGLGTGFLLDGKKLHEKLKGEIVLLTNAHVISDNQLVNKDSITEDRAIVNFEVLNTKFDFRLSKIIWTSPFNELDVTILRFDQESLEELDKYKEELVPYPVQTVKPRLKNKERLYIIGHPKGETLKISLQDNVFLDSKGQLIHYRTPTDNGSSGSPVFNENWDLIAIHHAGNEKKKQLDGSDNTYQANEGIWIQSIINGLRDYYLKEDEKIIS